MLVECCCVHFTAESNGDVVFWDAVQFGPKGSGCFGFVSASLSLYMHKTCVLLNPMRM